MSSRAFLRFVSIAVLILPALFDVGRAHAAQCSDRIDTRSPVLSDGFAFNASNARDNASLINSTNVASLQLAYTHAAVGSTMKKGAPAATQQALFFSAGANVIALNRESGCQYWSYTIKSISQLLVGANQVRSSSIYFLPPTLTEPALVLFGDLYGYAYAVNAGTGKQVWAEFLGSDSEYSMITGSPQVYNGIMYMPISSREVIQTAASPIQLRICCTTHGMLRAVNAYTGKIEWTYNTGPNATTQKSTGLKAPNGMSIWGTPAIDPERNTIYVGTGQNLTEPTTSDSDSIVAINLSNGQQKWAFQSTPNDAWNATCLLPSPFDFNCTTPIGHDYDFGAPPVLVHLVGGSDAIIAGAKNGVVYSLNPDTGALNWSQRIGAGGDLGGVHWGMATDGSRVYAAVSDITVTNIDGFIGSSGAPAIGEVPNATPGVYAIDLLTGSLVWEFHNTHLYQGGEYDSIYSAAVSVTNDVVFAGSLDGTVVALGSADGRQLWSYDTAVSFTDINGNAGNGGSIDSVGAVPAGSDLLVNSGYEQSGGANPFQAGHGDGLFVFRLPGN